MKRPNQLKPIFNEKLNETYAYNFRKQYYTHYIQNLRDICGNKRLKWAINPKQTNPYLKFSKKKKRRLGIKIKPLRVYYLGYTRSYYFTDLKSLINNIPTDKLLMVNSKRIQSNNESKRSKSHEIFQTKDKRDFIALFKKEAGFNNR